MSSTIDTSGFPAAEVNARAVHGVAAVYPDSAGYGRTMFGATSTPAPTDAIDAMRLVPPVFVPHRMDKLIELGREPLHQDVDLRTEIGGFASAMPLYVSAFGSTAVAGRDLGVAVCEQAGRCGIPVVIGENVVPVRGYRDAEATEAPMLARIKAYLATVPDDTGGLVVQQSTEDANAEVWNLVYSDPEARELLESGRLAFELKVGQGAKPGLGGMTLLDVPAADGLRDQYAIDEIGCTSLRLRHSSPGTFTEEVLRQQIRLMRNNYPRAKVWVKLPPARDIAAAVRIATQAGAAAVTVDGAEGGTGWAPSCFLDHVGLPLAECLRRVGAGPARDGCLLVSGRFWEGSRVVKSLALGARAAGLGRSALLAAAHENGLDNLLQSIAAELRLLTSALGKYQVGLLSTEDIWMPGSAGGLTAPELVEQEA